MGIAILRTVQEARTKVLCSMFLKVGCDFLGKQHVAKKLVRNKC